MALVHEMLERQQWMERAESKDPDLDIAKECKVVDKNLLATARTRLQPTLQEAEIVECSSSTNAAIDMQIDAAEAAAKRQDAVTEKMAEMKAEEAERKNAAGKGYWKVGWKGNGRPDRAQSWKKGNSYEKGGRYGGKHAQTHIGQKEKGMVTKMAMTTGAGSL